MAATHALAANRLFRPRFRFRFCMVGVHGILSFQHLQCCRAHNSGGGIRTRDLQVMGLASCLTAPPRDKAGLSRLSRSQFSVETRKPRHTLDLGRGMFTFYPSFFVNPDSDRG